MSGLIATTPPPARPICLALATATRSPARVGHLLEMVDRAVVGYEPFFDIKLVVFPEFAHAAPIYETVEELSDQLAVPIPNEHTDRYVKKARERGVLHPDRDISRGRSPVAGGRLQHHVPDRPGRDLEPVSQGESLAPLGGARQSARPGGLRRAALSRRRDRDRPPGRGHLLRLAVSRGDPCPGARRAPRS